MSAPTCRHTSSLSPPPLSLCLSLTHPLTHSLTHSLTHTHTHTRARAHSLLPAHSWWSRRSPPPNRPTDRPAGRRPPARPPALCARRTVPRSALLALVVRVCAECSPCFQGSSQVMIIPTSRRLSLSHLPALFQRLSLSHLPALFQREHGREGMEPRRPEHGREGTASGRTVPQESLAYPVIILLLLLSTYPYLHAAEAAVAAAASAASSAPSAHLVSKVTGGS